MTVMARPTVNFRQLKERHRQIQQQWAVTFDAGTTKECVRNVWMDLPLVNETVEETKARKEVEALRVKLGTSEGLHQGTHQKFR